jgi:hypothetical protein
MRVTVIVAVSNMRVSLALCQHIGKYGVGDHLVNELGIPVYLS